MARADFSTRTLFLSIRELANFLTPKYSSLIEYSPIQLNALEQGRKWHQKIQQEYLDQNLHSKAVYSLIEVFVSMNIFQFEGWNIVLRGRIDILIFDSGLNSVFISEIKTISSSIDKIVVDDFWELQVLFYSYLFRHIDVSLLKKQDNLASLPKKFNIAYFKDLIMPKLIVIQTLTGLRQEFNLRYDEEAIKNKLFTGSRKILQYFLPRINHFEKFRILQDIPWFFDEYRSGQEENLNIIRSGLKSNPIAMLIGPPGTGKTALTLRVLIERAILYQKQIMYTSTKNSQQLEVLHLIKLINVQLKNPLWAVVLLAKEKYCIKENKENKSCDPFTCEFFLAMSKNPVPFIDIFEKKPIIDSEWLRDYARDTNLFCPYYQAKQLSGFADFVIGDQNYQIDPAVKLSILKRPSHPLLFSKKGLPYLYLMDEAHNLPSRIRDVLSLQIEFSEYDQILNYFESLSKQHKELQAFYQLLKLLFEKLSNLPIAKPPTSSMFSAFDLLDQPEDEISEFKTRINNLRQKTDEGDYIGIKLSQQEILDLEQLYYDFYNSFSTLDGIFIHIQELKNDQNLVSSLFITREFIEILTKILLVLKEEDSYNFHCFYYIIDQRKVFEIYFLNISKYFQEELKNTSGTIIMSATLHPEEFYRVLFGFSNEVNYLKLNNYFPVENRLTLIVKDIKTRFADLTNYDNLKFIAQVVISISKSKKGKYLFFVPNLELISILIQLLKPFYSMCFSQFEENSLQTSSEGIFVCALGSIYSEGVNLPDLTGVIILSPGIPPPSYKNSLLQEYYKHKTGNGSKEESFNLAFRIPGLNKILQASGRLHRKSEDKGIVYLLGERFATEYYQTFYPDFLKPIKVISTKELNLEIENFWSKFD